MPADIHDLVVEQGATFSKVVNVSEGGSLKDLSGWLARAQIRRSKTGPALQTITATLTDAANGEVTLTMTSVETTAISVARGWWDLEIDDQAATPVVIRLLEGSVVINQNVTR